MTNFVKSLVFLHLMGDEEYKKYLNEEDIKNIKVWIKELRAKKK